jgi:hypothetical protein
MAQSQPRLDIVPLMGGVDQVTTPVMVEPGKLLTVSNFEPDINGGYRRMGGVERFDGHPSPTDGDYTYVVTNTLTITMGDTIATAGLTASGYVVYVDGVNVAVSMTAGTFAPGDDLYVGASLVGQVITASLNAAPTVDSHTEIKKNLANYLRTFINSPPGEGPIRGIWAYKNVRYAFRDNVGAAAGGMYKESPSGWVAITGGKEIQFTNSVGEIFASDTITGGTSGATATVVRALLRTGTWAASGAGTLIITPISGVFTATEAIRVAAVTKATSSSLVTDITLPAGGKYDFDNYNFFAQADSLRMYFTNGVGFLHEFDGTNLIPIRTGLSDDKPLFVKGHKGYLAIGVQSSLQISSVGNPYSWTALTGAAELGLGDTITGLQPQRGDANTASMIVTTKRKVLMLYGSSSTDFKVITLSPDTGGEAYTLQNINTPYMLDTKGIVSALETLDFGNFELGVKTRLVQPFINDLQGNATSSMIVRTQNQYRIFKNDGTGIILQVSKDQHGSITFFDYGDIIVNVATSYIDDNGVERRMIGSTDGMVYEIDKGTSFDGDSITAYFLTVFNTIKSAHVRKRFRRVNVQTRTNGKTDINVGYDLSYGASDNIAGNISNKTNTGSGGFWGNFIWDKFTWDGAYAEQLTIDTPGTGDSLAVIINTDSDDMLPFTIHTMIFNYSFGRMERK